MEISATIVALNEENNIARAIESLRGCVDEVVVVDSGSSDRTREIALSLGARVIDEPWRGYAAQKNFAAASAAHEWILSLDADEELTPGLCAEIAELKKQPAQSAARQKDAWTMPRRARYLGKWINHSGWYPDRKIRLYHRDRARWEGAYVHESVKTSGSVGELGSDLLHYTCDSLNQHFLTLDRYTSLAAEGLVAEGKRPSLRKLAVDPPWAFFRTYLFQRGFLDGGHGLLIAGMAALYTFKKYAKARDRMIRR